MSLSLAETLEADLDDLSDMDDEEDEVLEDEQAHGQDDEVSLLTISHLDRVHSK